jgi:hypothetical protein
MELASNPFPFFEDARLVREYARRRCGLLSSDEDATEDRPPDIELDVLRHEQMNGRGVRGEKWNVLERVLACHSD